MEILITIVVVALVAMGVTALLSGGSSSKKEPAYEISYYSGGKLMFKMDVESYSTGDYGRLYFRAAGDSENTTVVGTFVVEPKERIDPDPNARIAYRLRVYSGTEAVREFDVVECSTGSNRIYIRTPEHKGQLTISGKYGLHPVAS